MPDQEKEPKRATPEAQADFDAGVNDIFNTLFELEAQGKISINQVGDFFPQSVHERHKGGENDRSH